MSQHRYQRLKPLIYFTVSISRFYDNGFIFSQNVAVKHNKTAAVLQKWNTINTMMLLNKSKLTITVMSFWVIKLPYTIIWEDGEHTCDTSGGGYFSLSLFSESFNFLCLSSLVSLLQTHRCLYELPRDYAQVKAITCYLPVRPAFSSPTAVTRSGPRCHSLFMRSYFPLSC